MTEPNDLQQERDQLKARVAERDEIILQLRRKLAEAGVEGSPPPGVVTTIQQWSSRAHSAEARVAELEKEAAHDKATIEILSDEVRELRGDRDLCERTRTNMRAILDGVAAALKGTPEPLHAHDWSGLPDMARELRAQLAAARADTERLDWLERVKFGLTEPALVDEEDDHYAWRVASIHGRVAYGDTARVAIDAAKGDA